MSTQQDFSKIIRDVFALDPRWADWFMAEVFDERELSMSMVEARPAATLLSTPYELDFHGRRLQCDYISFVATVPSQRGKGLMRGLMRDVLAAAWEKETPFAALIPASRPLYFIYDRMGFATVFYVNEERYTALHQFEIGDYSLAEPTYEMFRRLEDLRPGALRHNEKQYAHALADLALSNGYAAAVSDGAGSEAIAFAENTHEIKIVDLLATDEKAAEAALAEAHRRGGQKAVIVSARPESNASQLRARGMIRIVNALAVFETLAAAYPKLRLAIRLRDLFLPGNNGTYVLEKGACKKADTDRKPDIDTTIDVMAKILFSDPEIGDLFNLPTLRPTIALMLD